jgi:hypothetical protein
VVFVFDWREVAEGRMESYRVVKGLDVIKEGGLSLLLVQGKFWSWKHSVLSVAQKLSMAALS